MAGPVDLVFERPPLTDNPVDLVFGEAGAPEAAEATLLGILPALTGAISIIERVDATLTGTLPPLVGLVVAVAEPPVVLVGTLPPLTGLITVMPRIDAEMFGELPALVGVVAVAPIEFASVEGTLPPLVGVIHAAPGVDVTVVGTLPPLVGFIEARYISGAQRPLTTQARGPWQVATPTEAGVDTAHQVAMSAPAGATTAWQRAKQALGFVEAGFAEGARNVRPLVQTGFQEASHLTGRRVEHKHQDAIRDRRSVITTSFRDALRLRAGDIQARHQDGFRDRRNWAAARWQEAVAHSLRHEGSSGPAAWLSTGWQVDYQEAMRPPAGTSTVPGPEVPDPCYTPPPGDAVHLVFLDPWTASTDLVFVCENHGPGPDPEPVATVVVPIRRVYVVLNESSLRRVDSDTLLPTFSMSMSLDVDSWTWSFSASLPGQALADLQPSSPGEPILVEVTINGVAYRMQVERRSRDRTFASTGIKISGRGLAATLDSPYSPVMNHANDAARTAQQLMNDVLTLNGVSIGWDVDWQAVDWSVPGGLFAHQGPYVSALNVIAQAAGSYIQPHPTAQTLRVLPRYPVLPWDWAAATPHFEIPSSVSTVEGIEWIDKAIYNRVFVSGVQDGVLGRVTRAETDGGLVAPMVTDPLITTAAAARQRGTPVLADVGSQAKVSLRLPVLAETGIIPPGKLVRYTDGGTTHRGITRSVNVDVSMPEIWQTIVLETHVL